MDGGDLYEYLERTHSVKEKLGVYRKIVEAVAYLHGQDVVHRDLKDSNVLFRGGEPVLTDFGIARNLREEDPLTRPLGTEGWAAPEQVRQAPVAKTMDVWALGKILAFLFTKSVDSVKKDQKDNFSTEIPAALHCVLARCLAGNPKRRYADAIELLAALPNKPSRGRVGHD